MQRCYLVPPQREEGQGQVTVGAGADLVRVVSVKNGSLSV